MRASAGHAIRSRSRAGAGPLRDGGHSYRKPLPGKPAQANIGATRRDRRGSLAFGFSRLVRLRRCTPVFTIRRGDRVRRRSHTHRISRLSCHISRRSSHFTRRSSHFTRRGSHFAGRSSRARCSGRASRPGCGGSTAAVRLPGRLLRRGLAPGGTAGSFAIARLSPSSKPIGGNLTGFGCRISGARGGIRLAWGRPLVAVSAGPAYPDPALSVGCCLPPRIHRADSNE